MSAPVCTIAVIVPVHNAAEYLPDCLDAIAAQQFDDFLLRAGGRWLPGRIVAAVRQYGRRGCAVYRHPPAPARGECRSHRRAAPGTGNRGRVDRVLRCG